MPNVCDCCVPRIMAVGEKCAELAIICILAAYFQVFWFSVDEEQIRNAKKNAKYNKASMTNTDGSFTVDDSNSFFGS